jgi:transcriptional regulator with XRE-family HTH domain
MSNPEVLKTGDILKAEHNWFREIFMTSPLTAADIGARLSQLRKDKGLTQGELAEALSLSQPMISDYERGELRLHGELIVQIVKILNVSTDELLGAKTSTKKTPSKNRRLSRQLQAIDQLPQRDQQALMRTIDAFISKS